MFDIGWTELLVIAVVAILVVGPKDLPRMLRSFGRYAGKVKRTANEFRQQFEDAIRESELDDIRKGMESITDVDPTGEIKASMDETMGSLQRTSEEIKRDADKAVPQTATEPAKTEPVKTGPGKADAADAPAAAAADAASGAEPPARSSAGKTGS